MDFLTTPGLQTCNTHLAAALSAVGIPLMPGDQGVRVLVGDVNRMTFFFQPLSVCGTYKTDELIRAWDDRDWHLANPEHPFAYIKVAFANSSRLLDYIKGGKPTVACRHGSKIAFMNLNAPEHLRRQVERELRR